MKAIFVGTLEAGFGIQAVVEDAVAEELVIARLANGELAEAMDVQDPSILSKRVSGDPSGKHFVVYGKGLGNGFEVFGPFTDYDKAERYAENHRSDDDEWELFEFSTESELEISTLPA